ncbi:FAD/NAD-P-binding domain-containing protein [Epithele typhae]|uniref:FAD/NAD-P-binding domain-containing protein n=1 Tax=Epithele typhae TaxID=378194 RepID=UPI002008DDF7|nr:FAD/NAD-P-binding domain-containing protein [Epithele typhae]KAH9921675.1 FAD/NAD-P-binding domain-containing protein [Epithele typhae]
MVASENPQKLRIAIAYATFRLHPDDPCSLFERSGSGFGGLLLAIFLQKYCPDHEIDIYEAAHEFGEIGAGVAMWPRVWQVLRYIGLEDQLLEATGTLNKEGAHLRQLQRRFIRILPLHRVSRCTYAITRVTRKALLFAFHRSQLHKVLVDNVKDKDKVVHFSKRLVSYSEPAFIDEPITLTFKDGTTATCDLLLGSDGIRSAVRHTMYTGLANEAEGVRAEELREMIDPVWSGMVVYRGLVPAGQVQNTKLDLGHVAIISLMSYAVSRGEFINVAAFVGIPDGEGKSYEGPWSAPVTQEEVAAQYATWDSDNIEKPSVWAVNTVRYLPTYVKGRVALLGDAAHAMTPNQGSGAGQAIEDGFILATILSQPGVSRATLPEALEIYDALRRPVSQGVHRRSRQTGHIVSLESAGWENVSAAESARGGFPKDMFDRVGAEIEKEMAWVGASSVMDDRARACEMVRERLV